MKQHSVCDSNKHNTSECEKLERGKDDHRSDRRNRSNSRERNRSNSRERNRLLGQTIGGIDQAVEKGLVHTGQEAQRDNDNGIKVKKFR